MKMRWGAALMAAAMLFVAAPQVDAEEAIPEDIYQWVQSTSRQNYYFNKQQMYFAVNDQGNVNVDVLLVPTLKTYDQVQKQDVISKRRWKMLPMSGYSDLVGTAEYLSFNLKDQTVQVARHEDLDSDWGVLSTATPTLVTKVTDLSDRDVDGIFYRAILKYANNHIDEIAARTVEVKKAKLTDSAKAELAALKDPTSAKASREVRKSAGHARAAHAAADTVSQAK